MKPLKKKSSDIRSEEQGVVQWRSKTIPFIRKAVIEKFLDASQIIWWCAIVHEVNMSFAAILINLWYPKLLQHILANVMLEYTLDDAMALLVKNIETAKKNLSHVEHDLDFLRDQFTTTEVNMARVYNWDVKRRQAAKAST
ncbi:Prefoldin subunit 3 [Homalodisca vitripennis]|nr:Prefoldin subunit 3 [Homalodisca vitripennis]